MGYFVEFERSEVSSRDLKEAEELARYLETIALVYYPGNKTYRIVSENRMLLQDFLYESGMDNLVSRINNNEDDDDKNRIGREKRGTGI